MPTARFGVFADVERGPGLPAHPARAVGGQDRRPRRRARACSSPPSLDEAEADVAAKLSGGTFGDAGRRVVVEEGLTGPECSLLVLCDGDEVVAAGAGAGLQATRRRRHRAQHRRHGRLLAGARGRSTTLVGQVMDEAVEPLVAALRARGIDYRGVLYAGLMLTAGRVPRCSSTTCASGIPRPRWSCPVSSATRSSCWRAVAEGRLPRCATASSSSPPTPRCAW